MFRRSARSFRTLRDPGLSLVELLVSLALGVILSIALVTAYLAAKRQFLYEDQSARMQENGRYAMRLLVRELGMAGFFAGSPGVDGVGSALLAGDCSASPWALDVANPVDLVNDYPGGAEPLSVSSTRFTCLESTAISPGTDLLALKRTAASASMERGVPASGLASSTVDRWYLSLEQGLAPRWERLRPIDLDDPERADFTRTYWQAMAKIFYIRRYAEPASGDENLPTLCMETLAGEGMTTRCLVEGVEDMQLEFGIDDDGDGTPDHYRATPQGSELRRAVNARIHLLLRSLAPLTGYRGEAKYTLGGKVRTAGPDAYLRRVFVSTVPLYNSAPLQPAGHLP